MASTFESSLKHLSWIHLVPPASPPPLRHQAHTGRLKMTRIVGSRSESIPSAGGFASVTEKASTGKAGREIPRWSWEGVEAVGVDEDAGAESTPRRDG
ncbi:hypothetical protein FIBSPDRAFT_1047741 [Athelia psychrophila]|uniref:Uncharacterized protein n=1 Tax=Athelia psychrophila TaxID=1759441 RepID=A0A166EUH8_9AGAM|nr:hypothetical protein FIBSPDRAFT_1047741 [Fibularhizoctonia sp. CBS 109695]